jgi:hypothetical protein
MRLRGRYSEGSLNKSGATAADTVDQISQAKELRLAKTDESNSNVFFGICYTYFKFTIFCVHLIAIFYFSM